MKLSEFELEIMQYLWVEGESTAPDVHKHIQKFKPVTYSTVKTIIDRLEDKKAIFRVKNLGRTIIYSAAISRDEIRKPMLSKFIDKVFSGNPKSLLNYIIQDNDLSKEDVEYLQELLKAKND